jgi:hypothetical protein
MKKHGLCGLEVVLPALILCVIPAANALPAAGALAKLLRFVPADSDFVLVMRIPELRGSEIIKKMPKLEKALSEPGIPREARDFFSKEGIDLSWDSIDEIVVSGSLADSRTSFLALIKGSWKTDVVIAALAKLKSVSRESGKNGTVYYLAEAGREHRIGFFQLDGSSLAVGAQKNLEAFLENRRGAKGGLSDDPLMHKLTGSSAEAGPFWGAVNTAKLKGIIDRSAQPGAPTKQSGQSLPLLAVLEKVKGLAVNVNTGKALDVELRGFADSPKDAEEVQQFARGIIAIAKLSTPQENFALSNFLDGIVLERQDEKIRLALTLKEETLKLFQGSTSAVPFPKQLFPSGK